MWERQNVGGMKKGFGRPGGDSRDRRIVALPNQIMEASMEKLAEHWSSASPHSERMWRHQCKDLREGARICGNSWSWMDGNHPKNGKRPYTLGENCRKPWELRRAELETEGDEWSDVFHAGTMQRGNKVKVRVDGWRTMGHTHGLHLVKVVAGAVGNLM